MPSAWFNPCGVPYRLWEDGRIEVEGQGFPSWDIASARAQKMATNVWGRWGAAIQNAAEINGIPPSWLVGIMQIESGGNPTVCSDAGACGLMQFIPMTCRMYGHEPQFYNEHPEQQIIDAGNLIVKMTKNFGGSVLAAVKAYNGCGKPAETCACNDTGMADGPGILGMYGQHDYVANFVRAANTFVALGLSAPRQAGASGAMQVAVIFFVLGAVGYMLADIHWGLTNS